MKEGEKQVESILPQVLKPGRYIDNEVGAARKNWTDSHVRFALAYPDLYEIGMSNLGLRILYHVLNSTDDVLCERVFAPWPDLEEWLKKTNTPLWTLESKRPLKSFDVIGFSLQYELDYTNIINMLTLANIPIHASLRTDDEPLIIAGGCCALNPMPLAPFFDCFFIGDAEALIPEVLPILRKWGSRSVSRQELLQGLSEMDGIWVPGFNRDAYRQYIPELLDAHFPARPIVPFVEIKQDKFVVEISRGCTRGCRFCQAGIFHRPYRERTPTSVLSLAKEGLEASGYREISLLALSASDHSHIHQIVGQLRTLREGLVMTLPSLRGDSLSESVAQLLLAHGGITIAPETGSERLRRITNKDIPDSDIMQSCELAARFGFTHIKLYYMVGLPCEDERDVDAIVDLTHRIARAVPDKLIKVALSPFVPKPHTPFQWESQENVEKLWEKIDYVKRKTKRRNIQVKYRDPRIALLEGIFSRGGDELSAALELAWKRGHRFDGWSEWFDYDGWLSVFDEMSVDPSSYLATKSLDDPLPWDHIHSGVRKEFLLAEREKAYQQRETRDCRIEGCYGCGVCEAPNPIPMDHVLPSTITAPFTLRDRGRFRYRVAYSKGEALRYLGHLDLLRAILRTIERARIPLVYSGGAKPRPKVSFTPPVPLGMTSREEYFDMITRVQLSEPVGSLSHAAPQGMEFHRADLIRDPSSLSEIYQVCRYRVPGLTISEARIEEFLRKPEVLYKERDIRAPVVAISDEQGELVVDIKAEKGKPWWVLEWLSELTKEDLMQHRPEREWL